MAKYLKNQKKKKPVALIVLLVVLIILIAFAVLIMPQLLYRQSGDGEESHAAETVPYVPESEIAVEATAAEPTEAAQAAVRLPVQLEDGRLEINSLFQYSGLNPDCGNQEGTDIAGIQLRNISGSQMTRATIAVTLSSGKQIHFTVEDLPAGMTALVFSDENISMDSDDACVSLSCEAAFAEGDLLMADRLSVSVEGTQITVTNISGDDLADLAVYCHCLLDQDCYGGLTYCYSIEFLPAGESAAVDAEDCFLGGAEVVRIGTVDQ